MDEVQLVPLKACFGEVGAEGAEPVGVATSVVVEHLMVAGEHRDSIIGGVCFAARSCLPQCYSCYSSQPPAR